LITDYEQAISKYGFYIATPIGTSMMPLLRERIDTVKLVAPINIKKHDVVLYMRNDKTLVLHRIIKVKNDGSIEYYDKGESYTYICNSIESYEEMKEFVYERMMPPDEDETIVFDDENLTIYFFCAGYKGNSTYDDFIIYRIEKFFNEDTSEETDEYLNIYTCTVTTNSEKNAYSFVANEKWTNKVDNYSGEDIEKYIFKKIK
jgi:hypothetical protein